MPDVYLRSSDEEPKTSGGGTGTGGSSVPKTETTSGQMGSSTGLMHRGIRNDPDGERGFRLLNGGLRRWWIERAVARRRALFTQKTLRISSAVPIGSA